MPVPQHIIDAERDHLDADLRNAVPHLKTVLDKHKAHHRLKRAAEADIADALQKAKIILP